MGGAGLAHVEVDAAALDVDIAPGEAEGVAEAHCGAVQPEEDGVIAWALCANPLEECAGFVAAEHGDLGALVPGAGPDGDRALGAGVQAPGVDGTAQVADVSGHGVGVAAALPEVAGEVGGGHGVEVDEAAESVGVGPSGEPLEPRAGLGSGLVAARGEVGVEVPVDEVGDGGIVASGGAAGLDGLGARVFGEACAPCSVSALDFVVGDEIAGGFALDKEGLLKPHAVELDACERAAVGFSSPGHAGEPPGCWLERLVRRCVGAGADRDAAGVGGDDGEVHFDLAQAGVQQEAEGEYEEEQGGPAVGVPEGWQRGDSFAGDSCCGLVARGAVVIHGHDIKAAGRIQDHQKDGQPLPAGEGALEVKAVVGVSIEVVGGFGPALFPLLPVAVGGVELAHWFTSGATVRAFMAGPSFGCSAVLTG